MMKKSAITFFALILFALAGLFFIATGFLPVDEIRSDQKKDLKTQSEFFIPSFKFQRIEKALLNSPNITAISDSINQLTNTFEKNYLTALLEKRNGEYEKSFRLLFSRIKDYPNYYPFYDVLDFFCKSFR